MNLGCVSIFCSFNYVNGIEHEKEITKKLIISKEKTGGMSKTTVV